jgi:hypothetical protein
MSLAGARLLARWCPAWRRREPGLRLLYGTWEGWADAALPGMRFVLRCVRWGEREVLKRQNRKRRSTDVVSWLADRLVVAVKPL